MKCLTDSMKLPAIAKKFAGKDSLAQLLARPASRAVTNSIAAWHPRSLEVGHEIGRASCVPPVTKLRDA